jgi:hypothetical protein
MRLLPILPLVFLTIHVGAGAGVWCELLLGPRKTPGEAVSEPMPLKQAA